MAFPLPNCDLGLVEPLFSTFRLASDSSGFGMAIGLSFVMIMAVLMIALSTSHFVSFGIATGRAGADARSRRAADVRGLRQAAQIARLNSELQISGCDSGIPWRVMEVAEIIDESADCRSFYLIDPYRQSLPEFRPGQYLMIRPALAGAYQTTRCYSLSSAPDSRYWRITVKRQTREGDKLAALEDRVSKNGGHGGFKQTVSRQGGLSAWLHESIGVGDCLLVGGPNGQFALAADNPRPLVLLAAGVGITPMASILRWSMQRTPQRPVCLLYQAKDLDHWPLGRTLHSWTAKFPACQVVSYFSRAKPEDLGRLVSQADSAAQTPSVLPKEYVLGRFDARQALQALPGADCDYFLCGPNTWMETVRNDLKAAGVAEQRIHWESFGSTTPTLTVASADPTTKLTVRFEASGVEALWSSPDQSLWELARENQVEIPSGCLSGVCGCCRVRLLAGAVAYDRELSVELADDECLACVARPKTDCRIDA
jgi:ferredoxin-NADP reductase